MDSSIRIGLSFQGLGLLERIPQDLVPLINQEIVDWNICKSPARTPEEIAACIEEMKIFWRAPVGTPPDQMIEGVIDVRKFARWAGENQVSVEKYLENADFTNALPYLEDLEFKKNCDKFDILATCRNVKRLNFTRCSKLTNMDLQHIKEFTRLTSLNLGWCNGLENVNLEYITQLAKLNSLNIGGGYWVTDEALRRIARLTGLNSLDLCWSEPFTDAGLEYVAQLTGLNSLNLNMCEELTDRGIEHLTTLTRLTSLDMAGCDLVTSKRLKLLRASLTNLTTLKSNWG